MKRVVLVVMAFSVSAAVLFAPASARARVFGGRIISHTSKAVALAQCKTNPTRCCPYEQITVGLPKILISGVIIPKASRIYSYKQIRISNWVLGSTTPVSPCPNKLGLIINKMGTSKVGPALPRL